MISKKWRIPNKFLKMLLKIIQFRETKHVMTHLHSMFYKNEVYTLNN
jgi:hypothetical protein